MYDLSFCYYKTLCDLHMLTLKVFTNVCVAIATASLITVCCQTLHLMEFAWEFFNNVQKELAIVSDMLFLNVHPYSAFVVQFAIFIVSV